MANILFDNPSPEGVSDIGNEPFSIFPNPVEDCIYLQLEDSDLSFSCELYDMQGKRLMKRENASSINVSFLPAGIYVLQINTAKGSQFQKIVKK